MPWQKQHNCQVLGERNESFFTINVVLTIVCVRGGDRVWAHGEVPKSWQTGICGHFLLTVDTDWDVAWLGLSRGENMLYLIPVAALPGLAAATFVLGSCFSMSATSWSIVPCTVWLIAATTNPCAECLPPKSWLREPRTKKRQSGDLPTGRQLHLHLNPALIVHFVEPLYTAAEQIIGMLLAGIRFDHGEQVR